MAITKLILERCLEALQLWCISPVGPLLLVWFWRPAQKFKRYYNFSHCFDLICVFRIFCFTCAFTTKECTIRMQDLNCAPFSICRWLWKVVRREIGVSKHGALHDIKTRPFYQNVLVATTPKVDQILDNYNLTKLSTMGRLRNKHLFMQAKRLTARVSIMITSPGLEPYQHWVNSQRFDHCYTELLQVVVRAR